MAASFASHVHPVPSFYKYYWWVFHAGSPVEGRAFLAPFFRLSTFAFVTLTRDLARGGCAHLIYNKRLPRIGARNVRFRGRVEYAMPFELDSDHEYEGHK